MLGKLEKALLQGDITEEEYKQKKTVYIDLMFELYRRDIITKEELYKRINQ